MATPTQRSEKRAELIARVRLLLRRPGLHYLVLRGDSAAARSRLCRWLATELHIEGLVQVLRASAGPVWCPGDGLEGVVAAALACAGLRGEALAERLQTRARSALGPEPEELSAWVGVLGPTADYPPPDPEEREVVLGRALSRLARGAPTLLVLEDGTWAEGALRALTRLRREPPRGLNLCVLVSAGDPTEEAEATNLVPLPASALSALMPDADFIPLDVPQAHDAEALPRRVLRLLQDSGEGQRRILELLAMLGPRVIGAEMEQVSQRSAVGDRSLLLRLARMGVLERLRGGWAFLDPNTRRRVLEQCAARGLESSTAAEAVDVLRAVWGPYAVSWRFASLQERAGALSDAITTLFQLAQEQHAEGQWSGLAACLDKITHLADQLKLPSDAEERVQADLYRSVVLRLQGRLSDAMLAAERAVSLAQGACVPDALRKLALACMDAGESVRAEALLARAQVLFASEGRTQGALECLADQARLAHRRGDVVGGEELLRQALELAPDRPDKAFVNVLGALARVVRDQGRLEEADGLYEEAASIAARVGYRYGQAVSLRGWGMLALALGNHEEALRRTQRALALMQRLGKDDGVALCLNSLAEIRRELGDLEGAEAHYREARAHFMRIGSAQAAVPLVNLGLTLVERRDFAGAEALLAEAARDLGEGAHRASALLVLRAAQLPCVLSRGDIPGAARLLAQVETQLESSHLVARDVAVALFIAAELGLGQGAEALPISARSVAVAWSQWADLDGQDMVMRCEALMDELAELGVPTPLGPVDLLRPLRPGTAGPLWLAWHHRAAQQVVVRIKTRASDLGALEARIRAQVCAQHAAVWPIWDQGAVSGASARISGRVLTPGAPYAILPLAEGGNLEDAKLQLTEAELCTMLLRLSDALAVIHGQRRAHGGVHSRNILLQRKGEPSSAALSDLSAAHSGVPLGRDVPALLRAVLPSLRGDEETPRIQELRRLAALEQAGLPELWAALGIPRGPSWWSEDLEPRPLPHGVGGLGVWPLRPVPMLGRNAEIERVASLLAESVETRTPRGLVIAGGHGLGKSELAAWLVERARGLHAARALHVVCGPGDEDALLTVLAVELGLSGLRGRELESRVDALKKEGLWCDDFHGQTLVSRLDPETRSGRAGGLLASLSDALGAALVSLAGRGPLLMVVDGAEWGAQCLHAAATLLEATEVSALVLVMVQPDVLGERFREATALFDLEDRGLLVVENIGPLNTADTRRLMCTQLDLNLELQQRLAQRSGGVPRLALELLAETARGGLSPTPMGSLGVNAGGAREMALPKSLAGVWRSRLERLFAGLSPESRTALELAALIGPDVVEETWREACSGVGVVPSGVLMDRLFDQQLAIPSLRGWALAHPALQDVLRLSAVQAGHAPRLHRACAEALSHTGHPEHSLQVARHLLAAGDPGAALAPLLTGVQLSMLSGDLDESMTGLHSYEQSLDAVGASQRDVRRAEVFRLRIWLASERGDAAQLLHETRQMVLKVHSHGWGVHLAAALAWLGLAERWSGRDSLATGFAQAAARRAHEQGDNHALALSLQVQAGLLADTGMAARGVELLKRAEGLFSGLGQHHLALRCALERGVMEIGLGRSELAGEILEQCLARSARLGDRLGEARAHNAMGELLRRQGEHERAGQSYRSAARLWGAAGMVQRHAVALLNLTSLELRRGGSSQAEKSVAELMQQLPSLGAPHLGPALLTLQRVLREVQNRWDLEPGLIDHVRKELVGARAEWLADHL